MLCQYDICYNHVHPSIHYKQCSIKIAKHTITLSDYSPIPTLSKCDFSHTCTAVDKISADIHRMSCCSSAKVKSLKHWSTFGQTTFPFPTTSVTRTGLSEIQTQHFRLHCFNHWANNLQGTNLILLKNDIPKTTCAIIDKMPIIATNPDTCSALKPITCPTNT